MASSSRRQNRQSSVLNLHIHITVAEIATSDWWKRVRNLKDRQEIFEIFRETNRQEKIKCFDEENKTKLTLNSFAGFPLSLIWSYFPLATQCLQMYLSEIFTLYLKKRYFTCRVDLGFYMLVKLVIFLLHSSLRHHSEA